MSTADTEDSGQVDPVAEVNTFSYSYGTAPDTGTATPAEAPGLSPRHQRILLRLALPLTAHVYADSKGSVYAAPVDVLVERNPRRTVRPDLFFVSNTRMKRDDEPEAVFEIGPDLVVEVFDTGESRRGYVGRLMDYTAIGVAEVWLVSPQSETIEVLRATEEGYETAALYGGGTTAASEVLTGFTVSVSDIFE